MMIAGNREKTLENKKYRASTNQKQQESLDAKLFRRFVRKCAKNSTLIAAFKAKGDSTAHPHFRTRELPRTCGVVRIGGVRDRCVRCLSLRAVVAQGIGRSSKAICGSAIVTAGSPCGREIVEAAGSFEFLVVYFRPRASRRSLPYEHRRG
jgi:hypothetical protein